MTDTDSTVLIVGASRGLGLALAREFASRGWRVIGTVRGATRTELHDAAGQAGGRIEIETLDIDHPEEIVALRDRLAGRPIDILLVNAGVTTRDPQIAIAEVDTGEFSRVMATNALGPMRVVEALAACVPTDGLVSMMSSGQGSITNNRNGVGDVYRASKAALNMLMRGFSARHPERAALLLAPGWIRTELGGDNAPFTLDESAPILADLLLAARGETGLHYRDRFGATVPW